MLITLAQSLASERGMKLVPGQDYEFDLFDQFGAFVDTLNQLQIQYLKEKDYLDYYLQDGEPVDDDDFDQEFMNDEVAFLPWTSDSIESSLDTLRNALGVIGIVPRSLAIH